MRNTITNLFRLRDKDDLFFAAEVLAFTENLPALPKEIKDYCDFALEFFNNKGYFPDAETVNKELGSDFTSVPMEDPATIVFKLREIQSEMREKYSSRVLMDVVAEKNIEKKKEMLDEVQRIAFSTELKATDMVSVTKPEAPISDLVEKHREKRAGLYTNIPELDAVVDGLLMGSMTTVCGYAGQGKCFRKGTLIRMYCGALIAVENVEVGNLLMGPDGEPRTVLSLAHGEDDMYKIAQFRGMSYTVNRPHILTLMEESSGKIVDVPLPDLRMDTEGNVREYKGFRITSGSNYGDMVCSGLRVLPEGRGTYYGFTLDGDGRFLLEDGTVTHNTQFAVNLTYHNAVNRGYNALVLTKEIPADYYRINLLARHSREIGNPISAEKLKKGTVSDAELKVIKDVEEDLKTRAKGDIVILDESADIDYSPYGFGPFLESVYSKYKFDMLVIDYLQLFRNHTPKNMKELDYLNRIVSTVRSKSVCIGGKNQIASVVLSQANREGYKQALLTGGKYPLSALSEANALERDSRYVIFLYFDDLLRSSSEIKLTLAKHRGGVTIEDPITTPFEPMYFYMGESAKDSGVHRNTYSVDSIKEFMKI